MAQTKIEWTEVSWNPSTGCTKISDGCLHCYAEKMAKRLKAMGQKKYCNGFKLTLHDEVLQEPYSWRKPRIAFVNSMSDLFHKDMPVSFIKKVFNVMNENPQHVFQVLTKRADILEKHSDKLTWSDNIWLGVTVENNKHYDRIKLLKNTGAKIKFLSCEPLLSSMSKINLKGIDWVIVGGESGPGARPMQKEWVIEIRDKCQKLDIPFFFKQWGGTNKKKTGSLLDGLSYKQLPSVH
jgi:protein gp37